MTSGPHVEATHDPVGQTRPHAPQFWASVARTASQPFAGFPSQSAYPALQENVHRPAWHEGALVVWSGAHAWLHAPQLFGSPAMKVPQEPTGSGGHVT